MAQQPTANGEAHDESDAEERAMTILVTGFGPFQERFPVNPSFEITRSLPSFIRTPDKDINIVCYGSPIRVCYDEVRELIPLMHEAYDGSIDLVLHVGMASGREFYTAELYAHRDGYYKNKDLDGKTLPPDHGAVHFGDCPPRMRTSLDYDALVQRWRTNLLDLPESSPGYDADCRPSDDAGHYLCDYIYFNSLAWCGRHSKKLEGGGATKRPVLFLHVPAESDEEMLEKGRDVTLALIEAMVDVWCQQTHTEFV
jgi:pyrrolidone-carboxylate peptidase